MDHIVRANDAPRIEAFLRLADREFSPALSERVDLSEYSMKLADNAENLFVTDASADKAHAAVYVNRQDAAVAYLSSICVLSEFRGERISQPLLDACCCLASDRGMHQVTLEVDRGNRRAIAFYGRNGFEDFGKTGTGSLLMTRLL